MTMSAGMFFSTEHRLDLAENSSVIETEIQDGDVYIVNHLSKSIVRLES